MRRKTSNASLPFMTKHPALLDKRHIFTTLVVKDAHECVLHNGAKETLTQVRSQYWIVKGRSFVLQPELCKMLPDNGKTFKSAARMISAKMSHPDVQRYFADVGIKWSFNRGVGFLSGW